MTAAVATERAVASAETIRSHFPALERRHDGHPVAYFDGPGGTQVPRVVGDRMTEYLYRHNANTHWNYPTSAETDALILDARGALADFVNGRPDEIAFGANMSTLTFHLARALGRQWGPDDEVVVTELDHHANVAPWHRLSEERGVQLRTVGLRVEDGTLDMSDLERAVGPRTRVLAIGAASNALGTVTDVRAAARVARAAGAFVFVDAVHYAPHVLTDVSALDCDFVGLSAYKFYGPHVGVLWGKRDVVDTLDVPKLAPAPDDAPEKLETGTQNHEGIVGAAAAVDYLASLSGRAASRRTALAATFSALHARGAALVRTLWTGLSAIPGVTLYGPPPHQPRTPTVAFTVASMSPDAVAGALARRGLFVSHGDFYAATVIERLGVGPAGVVRVGCSAYTTSEEVDRLLHAVAEIA